MNAWTDGAFPNKANGVQENLSLNSPHIFSGGLGCTRKLNFLSLYGLIAILPLFSF